MKFSVHKKDIHEKLQFLIGLVPSKANMMVLSNFKLKTEKCDNKLIIIGTDLNITTIVKLTANVLDDCEFLVNARNLADIINSLPDASINFTLNEESLNIECGTSSFSMNCVDVSLFPEIAIIDSEQEYKCDSENFKKMINNTVFATSSDPNQTIISGVYCKIEDSLITFAATDTKRISESKLKTNFIINEPYEIVIPPRALTFLEKNINAIAKEMKNLDSGLPEIVLKYDTRRISFQLNDVILISNRYEGRFPTYSVAFRHQPNSTLILDKARLRDAINRASLFFEDEDRLIKITLSNSEIVVESHLFDGRVAKDSINEFTYDGPDTIYCFNSKLFIGILGALETTEVILKFRSNEEPIWILNTTDMENMEVRFILMPIRIGR